MLHFQIETRFEILFHHIIQVGFCPLPVLIQLIYPKLIGQSAHYLLYTKSDGVIR
jgi:hypothetical protein